MRTLACLSALPGPLPEFTAARCVHDRIEQASCSACVDVCPRGAWQIDDEMLGIDPQRCDGCGLCAAACPPAAIRPSARPSIRHTSRGLVALACCPHSGMRADTDGLLPCLHSLTTRQLLSMKGDGVTSLITATGDCDSCERGQAPRLQKRLRSINQALNQRGLDPLNHGPLSAAKWHRLYLALNRGRGPEASPTGRRQWLLGGWTAAVRGASQHPAADEERASPGTLIPRSAANQILPRVPVIDPLACTGCDACIQVCPDEAIRLEDQAAAYRLEPEACSGCGLCSDVCATGAVQVARWAVVAADRLPLRHGRCSACGAGFHLPDTGSATPALCPVCRQVNHHQRLFQVLPD